MAARSVATATIVFGDLRIPVKLYSTQGKSDDGIRLPQLHAKDGGRLQTRHVCTKCGETVEPAQMSRGYERMGELVTVSADELKAIDAVATSTLELREYVPAAAFDPVKVEKSFYLGPDQGADKSLRVLLVALSQSGRIAVGSYSAHRRQVIACLRPAGELLVLHQMRYPHETVDAREVPAYESGGATGDELARAKVIIDQGARDKPDAAAYRDGVQERIRALLEQG